MQIEMIKKGLLFGIGFGAGIFGSTLFAMALSSYSAGEVLTAEKLNDNFNQIAAAIKRIPVVEVRDSAGAIYSMRVSNKTAAGYTLPEPSIELDPKTGGYGGYKKVERLYYTTSNCTGTVYAPLARKSIYYGTDGNHYYITVVSSALLIAVGSTRDKYGCSIATGNFYHFKLLPNNPVVTGFNPAVYTGVFTDY